MVMDDALNNPDSTQECDKVFKEICDDIAINQNVFMKRFPMFKIIQFLLCMQTKFKKFHLPHKKI